MTEYNIAVTVGPNIFRPKYHQTKDITIVGIYYELLILMMKEYEYLFEDSRSLSIVDSLAEVENKGVSTMNPTIEAVKGQQLINDMYKRQATRKKIERLSKETLTESDDDIVELDDDEKDIFA